MQGKSFLFQRKPRLIKISMKKIKKYIRKKSLSKTLWKKAFNNAESALIAMINRRDKDCQVASDCAVSGGCSDVLQMDHGLVSRKHKSTFFEPRQMILLCSKAHTKKTFKTHGFDVIVFEKIRNREGSFFVDQMLNLSQRIKKWSIQELEEMTKQFEELEKK